MSYWLISTAAAINTHAAAFMLISKAKCEGRVRAGGERFVHVLIEDLPFCLAHCGVEGGERR